MAQHVIYDYRALTLKQFLRLPEAKPALEYIDRSVVQKVASNLPHSLLQGDLCASLRDFCRSRKLGLPYIVLRCTFGGRSLVPDLCFIASGRIPRGPDGQLVDDILLAPDLVIEIMAPGETVKDMLIRMNWYVRNGVRLAWLIQPTRRRVFVVRPEAPREVLEAEAGLSGEAVLPGFELPLTELFGWLTED